MISETLARTVSDSVTPFLVAGELSLLPNKQAFTQSAKALGATFAATELLKHLVGEKRPNSDSQTSFPSGHTAAAFAMATVLTDYEPSYKWPAYITAAAIGYSRVEAGSHYWRDVVGGALLGHYVAKQFTNDHVVATSSGIGLQWTW
ncbi:MAG: phosphatase PAP2 family protein [Armatimonadota bacterium]|nr:phosphatase PAP2 family protein [bacterium]